jgi:hypothetical protein
MWDDVTKVGHPLSAEKSKFMLQGWLTLKVRTWPIN